MSTSNDLVLVKLDTATLALAECKTAMEAKQIADVAEAARVYMEHRNASVVHVNRAIEVRELAEHRLGAILRDMPKNKGASGGGEKESSRGAFVEPRDVTPTLRDLGISKKLSARAQHKAAVPLPEFQRRIDEAKESGRKISATKLVEPKRPRMKRVQLSRGLMVAKSAIAHLETIQPDDKEYSAALELVNDWVKARIKQLTK